MQPGFEKERHCIAVMTGCMLGMTAARQRSLPEEERNHVYDLALI